MSPQQELRGTVQNILKQISKCAPPHTNTRACPRVPQTFYVNYNKPTCKYKIARVLCLPDLDIS